MLLPSKVTSFNESIFSTALQILKQIKGADIKLLDLLSLVKGSDNTLEELVTVLELLYSLGLIELTDNKEVHYVG